ncbi:MAG: hypothetical protein ACK4RK_05545 [Gemmataceae bacterium]
MSATVSSLAALLLSFSASQGHPGACCPPHALGPGWPCPYQVPNTFGPGTFCSSPQGMRYGPNYNLVPPFPPFNGLLPVPAPPRQGCVPKVFPTHPYARSPRDFFMLD